MIVYTETHTGKNSVVRHKFEIADGYVATYRKQGKGWLLICKDPASDYDFNHKSQVSHAIAEALEAIK